MRATGDRDSVQGCDPLGNVEATGYMTTADELTNSSSQAVRTVQIQVVELGGDTVLVTDAKVASRDGSGLAKNVTITGEAYRCAGRALAEQPNVASHQTIVPSSGPEPRTASSGDNPAPAAKTERSRVAGSLFVRLRFTPQDTINSPTPLIEKANPSRAIQIAPMVDARQLTDLSLIGENSESKRRTPVRAESSIAQFSTEVLKTCLLAWGVKISSEADLILNGQVVSFFVKEENRYTADVNFRFRLQDRAGHSLWEGLAAGQASTWGSSLSAENYNQVLSDALKVAYANLLGNPTFQVAWSGQSSVSVAPAVSSDTLAVKILILMREGLGEDVIADYVRTHRPPATLSAEEIVEWKRAGIAESVIKAALGEGKAE